MLLNRAMLEACLKAIIEESDGDGLILTEADASSDLAERLAQAVEDLLDAGESGNSSLIEPAVIQALRDIIAAGQANGGDALANAVTTAQEILSGPTQSPDVIREAVEHALTNLQDLSNGWSPHELHEPVATTLARLQAILGGYG